MAPAQTLLGHLTVLLASLLAHPSATAALVAARDGPSSASAHAESFVPSATPTQTSLPVVIDTSQGYTPGSYPKPKFQLSNNEPNPLGDGIFGCDDVGDCRTLSVKWGHPAPYTNNGVPSLKPADVLSILRGAYSDATDGHNGQRTLSDAVSLPYDYKSGSLEIKLQMASAGLLKWSDVAEYLSCLLDINGNITQPTSGIIWSLNDASKQEGKWALFVSGDAL